MTTTVKTVVEEVLNIKTTKALWTSSYTPVLPITPQNFSLDAVLPAMFYMFRWGQRRGKGKFTATFGEYRRQTVNEEDTDESGMQEKGTKKKKELRVAIDGVAQNLSRKTDRFVGFNGPVEMAILGDLLLTYCLENKKLETGRQEQVQRVFPTHYYASWIDLPELVVHLRYVPEMVVALLADQPSGKYLERNQVNSHFPVGADFKSNLLLELFGSGMGIAGLTSNLTSDRFDENEHRIGIDQLLTIRMAQECGEAPLTIKGEVPEIPNQWPLARKAMEQFKEDLNVFIQAYGRTIPRKSLLSMLESCLSLGLTHILLSTVVLMNSWEKTGRVTAFKEQQSWPVFVDCSSGVDHTLRQLAEESMGEFLRQFDRLPIIMMCLRVLEQKAKYDAVIRQAGVALFPSAEDWINLLGDIYSGNHERALRILEALGEDGLRLADALEEANEAAAAQTILTSPEGNQAMRLAEGLCLLMGDNFLRKKYVQCLDSCLMSKHPNGLAHKRKTQRTDALGKRRSLEMRAILLPNTMLDYMVHRHLRKAAKGKGPKTLTFMNFMALLRERYGLYINQAPPGMSIPAELLLRNQRFLERRLRDLGVLVGVNDAESMKRLRQRFQAEGDDDDQ